jgi:hypothetical protein
MYDRLKVLAGLLSFGAIVFGTSYCNELPKYRFERRIPGIVSGWPGARLISSFKSVDLASPVSWFWPPTTVWTYAVPDPTMIGRFTLLPVIYGEDPTSFLVDVDCKVGSVDWYALDEPETAVPAIDLFRREVKTRDGRVFRSFHPEQKSLNETQMSALCHTDWRKEKAAVWAASKH